ncbi:hypothetical protein EDB19DRAFT_1826545 [Suillus lakei]|nr:hypothetical protein EDB19DRAFT_1826545 [Suillus lakei]
MNRLASDPSLEHCPDFASNIYQAIENLQAVWVVTSNTHKVQWQRQLQEDQAAATKQQSLVHGQLQVSCLEGAARQEEDRRQNPLKYIPIPDRSRPPCTIHDVLISDFALTRVIEGQYVALYYWTNGGLQADARFNHRTADNEGMGRSASPGSSTTAGAAHHARVIPDHSLTAIDFAQAVPRALASFKQCGWEAWRIQMLAAFWQALMCHDYWNSTNPLAERALFVYQDEQRRAWHQAIPLPDGAWDISILDQKEIRMTFDKIYREDQCRRDDEWDLQRLQSLQPRDEPDDHSSTRRARRSRRSSGRARQRGRGRRRSASLSVHSNSASFRN